MRSGMLFGVAIALALAGGAHADEYGTYPSTYPFNEDGYEGYVPVALEDTGMPDFTFDNSDTGGYYLYGAIKYDMAKQNGPVFACAGPLSSYEDPDYFFFFEHLGKGLWNMRLSHFPMAAWNCSGGGGNNGEPLIYSQDDFPGVMNGDVGCGDTCCSEYVGHAKYGADQLDRQKLFSDVMATNGCNTPQVQIYCGLGDSWHWICQDQYLSRTDRAVNKACYDSFVYQMTLCTLFKVSGAYENIKAIFAEPVAYIDNMSVEQTFVPYSIEYTTQDRVCYPYTYYNPAASPGEAPASSAVAAHIFGAAVAASLFA